MKRGFVFSSMGLLLVIPTIVLAASFLNMVEYGGVGSGMVVLGDNVYYDGKNILDFLVDGARAGNRTFAVSEAEDHASDRGYNLTITPVNCSVSGFYFDSGAGHVINKTFLLKLGGYSVDLTMFGQNLTVGGVPVYFRDATIYTTTNVTHPNGSCVDSATVTITLLETTYSGASVSCGIYNVSAALPYVGTDACTRKASIGTKSATSTAESACWYDGTDSQEYKVYGLLSSLVTTLVDPVEGDPFDVLINAKDEVLDPITNVSDCANFSQDYPTLYINIYEDDGTPPVDHYYYEFPYNITDYAAGAYTLKDGNYLTNDSQPIYIGAHIWTYLACISWADYINATGNTFHCETGYLFPTDLEPLAMYLKDSGGAVTLNKNDGMLACGLSSFVTGSGAKKGIEVVVNSSGGTEVAQYGLNFLRYNGTAWVTYYEVQNVTATACIPSFNPTKNPVYVAAINNSAPWSGSVPAGNWSVNITYVIPPDTDNSNNWKSFIL